MELELKEYLGILKKRAWIIIAIVLAASVFSGVYSMNYAKRVYFASTKLIVSNTAGQERMDLNSMNADLQLINTYKEILKTPVILDKVVANHPEFNLSSGSLYSKISISSKELSQVMTIGIQDTSQARAAKIANAVAEVFKEEIPTILRVNNVSILSEAQAVPDPVPISPNVQLNVIIAFVISLVISIAGVFLLERLNDSVKSEKDVEQLLGLPLLSVIPKNKKKYLARKKKSSLQRTVGEKSYASSN